mmetsp:Transcript_27249/g.37913  ORF Transcript_27249/g.37913 Transcript_27249/m.37913 type:complete len:227 (-) Transcript_27249:78-758(-)
MEDVWVPPDEIAGQKESARDTARIPSLMERLNLLWTNERLCMDLLHYDEGIVNAVLSELSSREEAASTAKSPSTTLAFDPFDLIRTELTRCKYILSDYLRIRLEKIAEISHSLPLDEVRQRKLSPQEKSWVTTYARMEHSAMLDGGLGMLPEELHSLTPGPPPADGEEILCEAPLHHYVFTRVLVDVGSWDLGGEANSYDLKKGDLYALKYGAVADLIKKGKAALV